jgi:aspartate/methionine/tyrosine aminotransferase
MAYDLTQPVQGEDIIDFGMGNPDQPTPKHIVDKMVEATKRSDTHRYSVSRGVPRLRRAICNWAYDLTQPVKLLLLTRYVKL